MDVINSLLRAARAGNLKRVIEFIEDDLVDINSSNQNGLTALHSASKEGHVRVVQELISHGANVHAKTLKGNTALHIASLAGQEPVVRILIENGADVDTQSASGFTALYMAAQENHIGIVKLLLASGANQNVATTDGFTPLAVAMQQGHEQIASILLNNEARGRIRFPGTTESGRSLLHIAAKKDDCAAAALLMQNNISPDITSKTGFTALHIACRYGNVSVAKLLIERQADVNFQAKHNITPLHVAAKWGQDSLVDLLLANSARIDATTRDGLTPLHCAARSGHDGVVETLIRRGAPISAKTRSGLAPLHMATQGDHHRSAQILLDKGAPVDDVTVDYLTALHVASHCGHVKVAKLLLNNKADPNFRALNGFTSLHIACKKNRIKIVELLLKYGASLNAVTESGLTPLHVASFMGCVNIVIYLLDNHANIESVTVRGETPLHLATRANQIEVINILLKYGANVSARAKESQTALHIASRLGNADIARLLIDQGVDVDAPTKDSYSALHIASKEGHAEVVNILLNHGANISCATRNHGFTPLHLAAKYGIDSVVDLLLSYGAPVDAQGKNGVTPLHVATHYDHPNIVQLLLMNRTAGGATLAGASPHAMAKNGYTALHIAAKGNRIDIAETLLQYSANPNADSKAGFSPLHLAAQEGRRDMAALLLNNGANVNCKAKNGITPLHLCAQEDHVHVAQLLVKRGALLNEQTRGGFTPLHVASHFARMKMIRFLLANGANVNIPTASGYTPLHQASQQGDPQIVQLLLEHNAKPDALTDNGQTALSIAQNLGYVSIIDTLKVVTETIVKTTTMTITEEKFKIISPETMQETFVSDSEDEADDQAHAESVKFLTTEKLMKNFNTMADDYHTSQSNLMAGGEGAGGLARQQPSRSSSRQQVVDEMSQDLNYLNRDAPLDGGESTFGVYSQLGAANQSRSERDESLVHMGSEFLDEQASRRLLESPEPIDYALNEQLLNQLSPDNVDIQRPLQQAGFLVSFMVDARGGAMRGCRHSGVRVIIPPHSAQMPMRITCRYLRQERLMHPPPLMEGEACASKIMEVGPAGAKFLGPVLLEVPHFASLRGQEREIIILRSDRGDVWREHLSDTDEKLVEAICQSVEAEQLPGGSSASASEQDKRRITRIVTSDFPQYFAIISRIRQEVHPVGPEGSLVSSSTAPRAQVLFTEGALTKRIKIGLQPKKKQQFDQEPHQEQQPDSLHTGSEEAPEELSQRPGTPLSGEFAGQSRPSSAQAKRRSKLLACFGANKASTDLLHSTDDSSAGGDSPRRAKRAKPNAAGELDSEGEFRCSPSPDSLSGGLDSLAPTTANLALVPHNYYIEPEPPLILNLEPKTYGKRLASSSAQTEAGSKSLSSSVRAKPKRGFLGARKRDKAQLVINCNPAARPKSANLSEQAADSSLDSVVNNSDNLDDIRDVVTSDDHKWRTCTIQTDSDSLQVNYVSLNEELEPAAASQPPREADKADDGYVSGSGELKQKGSRGFFGGLSFGHKAEPDREKEPQRARQKKKEKPAEETSSTDSELEPTSAKEFQQVPPAADKVDAPKTSGKELKQQRRQEKEASERKAKEEKRQKKELEQQKRKQEKEAKREAKKSAKKASSTEPLQEPERSADQLKPAVQQVSFASVLVEERQPEVASTELIQKEAELDASGLVPAGQIEQAADEASQKGEESSAVEKSVSVSVSEPAKSEEQPLKPILKQQSLEAKAPAEQPKISSVAEELVSEATEEAVKIAEGLQSSPVSGSPSKKELARVAKEEKERLKKEAKLRADEEKRLKKAKELEEKKAKEEKKRLEKEAKKKVKQSKNKDESLASSPSPSAAVGELAEKEPEAEPSVDPKVSAVELPEVKSEASIVGDKSVEEAPISVAEKSAKSQESPPEKVADKKKKKAKREKRKADASDGSEQPSASSGKSLSLLERLFKRRSSPKNSQQLAIVDQPASLEQRPAEQLESSSLILSEMYPSDPGNADGEMILEVNVPQNLIDEKRQLESVVQETVEALKADLNAERTQPSSPTMGTTLDESSAGLSEEPKYSEKPPTPSEHDQEATLVNISQLVTSELNDFDEDATENVVSQINELNLDSPSNQSSHKQVAASEEQVVATTDAKLADEPPGSRVVESGQAKLVERSSSSELNLKEEKTKRELEAKLEKEAKKRAKEDEKLKKKLEKEEKARAEKEKKAALAEAKRKLKEEKEKAKMEAKQQKKAAELAKKQQKKEKVGKAAAPTETVVAEEQQVLAEGQPTAGEAQEEPTIVEASEMKPVKTETEVQRIVEEVVGEDGVITKTTKTIETKYVTLRQEETQLCERTDVPIDEYNRIRRASSSSSFSSGSSIDSQGERRQKQTKRPKLSSQPKERLDEPKLAAALYEHKELDEILSTPSYFYAERPPEVAENLAPKKELKKRIKLNKLLVKRARKLAKSEAKTAKRKADDAQAEIVVCDEAVKEAQKQLKRSLKESKHALKLAKKSHKKMDKIDKKLAKRQKKIEDNQEKLDKKAEKLAKKAEKAREKQRKKEAKLERKSSSKSSSSRKSIKLEDIGEPVLRSSSRLNVAQQAQQVEQAGAEGSPAEQSAAGDQQTNKTTVIDRASPASDDMQVEMSLDDAYPAVQPASQEPPPAEQESAIYTKTTETLTSLPDGTSLEEVAREEALLSGAEAKQALESLEASNSDEEVDVVSELPDIKSKLQH